MATPSSSGSTRRRPLRRSLPSRSTERLQTPSAAIYCVSIFQARDLPAGARYCCPIPKSSKLAIAADGGVGEIYQAVAVVDFYVEQDQHAEAEGAGDFGAERFADVVEAESDQALAILFEMGESEVGFVRDVDVFHIPAQALHAEVIIAVNFGDLFGGRRGDGVVECSGIHGEKHVGGVVFFGGNQQHVAEAENRRVALHLGSEVTIVPPGFSPRFRLERGLLRRRFIWIGRQLAELEFAIGEVEVYQKVFEDIGADESIVTQHGTASHHVHVAAFELQVADLYGIHEAEVTCGCTFVADSAHVGFGNFLDAGFVGDFFVDGDAAGAGVEHKFGGSAINFYA